MREVTEVQLGHRLAQLREGAGMKQAELAREVTWSQAVLSRVEAGERAVSSDELEILLRSIGTEEAAELAEVLAREWRHLPAPALDHPDQNMLWRAEVMVAQVVDAGDSADIPPAFRVRLEEYRKEIATLASQLLRREHQIAFIGSIGIGKSTVICRATKLETAGPQGRVDPVLETGAGGSTLCEVHLSSGPGFGIVVEPRSHDDIRSDTEDFVDQILRTEKNGQNEDSGPAVPREIERAIRNMAGLTQRRSKNKDGKSVITDPAKELAQAYPERRDLVVEVLTRMGLHRRDRRDEWHSPDLSENPLEWMRTIFAQINNGRHPEFSLPERIELIVPQVLEAGPLQIDFVDTRGIDQPSARADLEELLEDPHTVSILCTGFNDAPAQSVQHLVKRAREINNRQIDSNAGLLVLARPDEALAVKDEGGFSVETAEEGYELKDEQVRNALMPYCLDELAICFFNSREDEPDRLRDFLRDRINETRTRFQSQLDDVLIRTQSVLENAEREQAQAVQRDAGRHLATWINQHPIPVRPVGHVHDTLMDEIAHAHASTVNAAVRRSGEWRSLSYTHQLGHGARKAAVATLQAWVIEFGGLCVTLASSMPEASQLFSQARQLMNSAYDDLLRKIQLAGLTYYRDQLRDDSDFWSDSINEWGQGPGYLGRVLGLSRGWFEQSNRRDIESQIDAVLAREWSAVLERVQAIFDEIE